jgi:hypothetical protein
MSLRAEIRGVLAAGPRNAKQIAELCGCTDKQAANNLYVLKTEGKIKIIGTGEGHNSYAIADWPEKPGSDAPKSARGKRGKKAARQRAAEAPAPAPQANGSADEFAITDSGVLAIKQGELAIQIRPEAFARLRTFIERAESIFNPPQE